MITEVKECRVKVEIEGRDSYYFAVVRDGNIKEISRIFEYPTTPDIEAYITFLSEILESIKQTQEEG